jgi:dTDP-glucose 4,6-dehydratase
MSRLFVTGGAGFIGSTFVHLALHRWPEDDIIVYDALTYAGNLANLADVLDDPRVTFVQGDITDPKAVARAMAGSTRVVNFAAETHVDRSVMAPERFVGTNVEGVRVLLEATRDAAVDRFLQVSTDEVYGDIEVPSRSHESDPLHPRSPYSATKAGGDLMVAAYHATFGVPTLITRGSNTYGPYQYPEKLVPLFVTNALEGEPLPVYGDGRQMRDWLYVWDHCTGIATVLDHGIPGAIYNLGAGNERPNMEIIDRILEGTGAPRDLLRHVPDRPGHDRRYALDSSAAHALGWRLSVTFEEGIGETIRWYREHEDWWGPIKCGEFREYYRRQYEARLRGTSP